LFQHKYIQIARTKKEKRKKEKNKNKNKSKNHYIIYLLALFAAKDQIKIDPSRDPTVPKIRKKSSHIRKIHVYQNDQTNSN
jgi:hypothetical protein